MSSMSTCTCTCMCRFDHKVFCLNKFLHDFCIVILMHVGHESGGVCKPVPAKALLPVLDVLARATPTPPPGPPPDIQRPTSELFGVTIHCRHIYTTVLYMH